MILSKLKLIACGSIGVIVVAVLVITFMYNSSVDVGDQPVTVIIEQGDTFSGVSRELSEKGIVKWPLVLKAFAKLGGVDTRLTPGRYDFVGENSVKSVLERLRVADFYRVRVTIPEGSPIWKVASILQEQMGFDSTQLIALNNDTLFLDSLELPSLEGYLFPETYFFPWGVGLRQCVRDMVGQFHALTDDLWSNNMTLSLNHYEILILASIIESETSLHGERGLVASVYVNRLRDNMRLDADPTVIYGLGGLDRPLYRKDLRKKTPYNTYINKGLPPTPINSPGLASIEAALDPDSSEYYFFVADETGGHHFSRTNAEHNQAIRRIRSGQGGSK